MHFHKFITVLVAILLAGSEIFASAPNRITLQGMLTDSAGTPLPAGPKSFIFRIYDAEFGGAEIWPGGAGETQTITSSSDGLWIGLVGAINPLSDAVFSGDSRWLQITVDGTTLPRVQLATDPYAFRIATVDGASGGTITSKVSIGPGHTNTGSNAFVAGESNQVGGTYSTIAGGSGNQIDFAYSFIGGGLNNLVDDINSVIGGGRDNSTGEEYSFVGGGLSNNTGQGYSVVVGGQDDTARGDHAFVGGGQNNMAAGVKSFVGGGSFNSAYNAAAAVAGGSTNRAEGSYSFVGGGSSNRAQGWYSFVGGGQEDTAIGNYSVVGGGWRSRAVGTYSVVAGGFLNRAVEDGSIVAGGDRNNASAAFSAVVGGSLNDASGRYSFVGSGVFNYARDTGAVVVGGLRNDASGRYSVVGGGGSLLGGEGNLADGDWSTIPGGIENTASGRYSFAAGRRAQALHHGAFVWADSTDADFASTGINQFLIRASGGVGIGTGSPTNPLHVTGAGTSSGGVAGFGEVIARFKQTTAGEHCAISIDALAGYDPILYLAEAGAERWSIRNDASGGDEFQIRDGSSQRLVIDSLGQIGIGDTSPDAKLDVVGNVAVTGNVCAANLACPSDERLKRNIRSLSGALGKLEQLKGVQYEWNREEFSERQFPVGVQVGLIAQDVRDVVPQAVVQQEDGYLAVDYARLVPLLIEAIKEQQRGMDKLRTELAQLRVAAESVSGNPR